MHKDPQHLSDDVCVDLLLEQLPAESAREALRHLTECAECERHFQEFARQWELAAVHAPRLISRQRGPAHSTATRTTWSAVIDRLRRKRWLVPAAAAAVMLALVMVPRLGHEPRPPLLTKLPVLSETIQPRAALPPQMNGALLQGIEAYNNDDFSGAVEALESVDTDGPLDAFRRIYLANALAWLGRYADAAARLDGVPFELVPEPWSSEAQWTLYVALSATGETARAQTLLQELRAMTGEVGDRAREVQEE